MENFTEDQEIELDPENRRDGRRRKGELMMNAAAVARPERRLGGEKAQRRSWKGDRCAGQEQRQTPRSRTPGWRQKARPGGQASRSDLQAGSKS